MKKIDQTARYFETNEWARKDLAEVTLGITDFAQTVFGNVVFVETQEVGKKIQKGDLIATIESNKTASDILSPLSGEIVAVNLELLNQPELINSSPYMEGWLVKIKLTNEKEWQELMTAEAYQKYMKVFYNKI